MSAKIRIACFSTLVVVFWSASDLLAQNGPLPVPGGKPMSSLTSAERGELGDPFFDLVLKANPNVGSISQIEDLIQPDGNSRRVFVVSEDIINPNRNQSRRSVISFTGFRGGHALDNNVMLSVFFSSEQFPDRPGRIEALGWDSERGRYNYYLRAGNSWRFSGDSRSAASLTPTQRNGTCMECHVNGAPIMKELLIPWNNWRSFETTNETAYLTRTSPNAWPVAQSTRLRRNLAGAEVLEGSIIGATDRFIKAQISSHVKKNASGLPEVDGAGNQSIQQAKLLLRHLFLTTEINMVSSRTPSGLHPFPTVVSGGPSRPVDIPSAFFLNSTLIGGQNVPGFVMRGLGITQSRGFSSFARISPSEYKQIINDSRVKLGGKPGDAFFTWFTPEPSLLDAIAVDLMMRQGILTPEFVAAVQAIDLETPIMSAKRASLLDLIPDSFQFKPLPQGTNPLSVKRHPDALTQSIIAQLESSGAAGAQAEFLVNLKSADPIASLSSQVSAYSDQIKGRLSNAATRQGELKRLHDLLIQRRRDVNNDEVFKHLNESRDRLFPVP